MLVMLVAASAAGATLVLPWLRSSSLTLDPATAIVQALVVLVPMILFFYSNAARSSSKCRACTQGFISIPIGAAVIAFFAIMLGAPYELQYAWPTFYWSMFMSTLMVAPAATVFGTSWDSWKRVFAFTKPNNEVELSICLPAHGAAVGAWVGAWPMPLDWDRKWQEWPISCTYGAIAGFTVGAFAASVLTFRYHRLKQA